MAKDVLKLDFETFSEVDLTEVGSHNYANHESTEILMAAYKINDQKIAQWSPVEGQECPAELDEALDDPEVDKWAWNAAFEMTIIKYVWGRKVNLRQWKDTMVLGHYCGFPGKLEQAGLAIGLPEEKMKNPAGKRLMKKFSMMQTSRKKANYGEKFRIHWWQDYKAWVDYLEYNRDDVESEDAIWDLLIRHDMPEWEWENWWIDQQINQAGVPINMNMVNNAVEVYEAAYEQGFAEMQLVSGLDNPMSPKQLLPWMKDNGYMYDDCQKGHIRQALSYFDETPEHWEGKQGSNYIENEDLQRVLELRLELSRSSIKKFHALQRATSADGNLRNTLQFMGASRTGRWAGRVFQPQNLPRPNKEFEENIEIHAKNVERLSLPAIQLIYDNPFDLLASCIRPAAQAPEGYVFIDADLNAIENRVLGWMAGCRKILRVFELDRDPYIDFATYLFNRDYDELWHEYTVLKVKEPRTIAKPGVLGCLKGETPVLTDKGWKAIVEVGHEDWLWDGQKWVKHEGVVYKGQQEVLSRSGIHATPDHRFLTPKGWVYCQQVFRQPMFKSALDMGNGSFLSLQDRAGPQAENFFADVNVVENDRYRDRTLSEGYPHVAPDVLLRIVAPPSGRGPGQSFSTFSQIVSTLRERVAKTLKIVPTTITADAEYVWGSVPVSSLSNTWSRFSEQMVTWKSTALTTTETTSGETLDWQLDLSKIETADTWDILNTGDYARFVVLTEDGPLVSHNCGYMLGPGKKYVDRVTGEVEATGLLGYAWDMGIRQFTPEQSKLSVDTFRREFKEVKDYWYAIERAAIMCVRERRRTSAGPVVFDIAGGSQEYDFGDGGPTKTVSGEFLRMLLPSGRYLHYFRPKIQPVKMPWTNDDGGPVYKDSLTYEGQNEKKQWRRMSTHPGKLTENGDQAISRDLLVHGMRLAKQKHRLDIRLHVHDQNVGLVREDQAHEALEILNECMKDQPHWADGLPLGSEGFFTKVFKKD